MIKAFLLPRLLIVGVIAVFAVILSLTYVSMNVYGQQSDDNLEQLPTIIDDIDEEEQEEAEEQVQEEVEQVEPQSTPQVLGTQDVQTAEVYSAK